MTLFKTLPAGAAVSVFFAACGADKISTVTCLVGQHQDSSGDCVDNLVCGAGTFQQGDDCVPAPSTNAVFCGPGTTQLGDVCLGNTDGGTGSTNTLVCGPGTAVSGNECLPTSSSTITCGVGTTLVDGQCVPSGNGSVTCGAGTMLVGNQCLPSSSTGSLVCGPGTEQVGNECLVAVVGDGGPHTSSSADGGSEATSIAIDPAHDNAQPFDTIASPLTPAWSLQLNGPVSFPLVAQGLVIVSAAESQPNVRAVDLATGQLVWGPIVFGSPVTLAYDNGAVFALDTNGNLAKLDAATGHRGWTTQCTIQYVFDSPPVAAGGFVFVDGAGEGGTTYAFNESDGSQAWTADTFDGSDGTVAVVGSVVYESEACDQLSAFDLATGTLNWFHSGNCTGGGGAAPSVYDGLVWMRDWASGNLIVDTSGHAMGGFSADSMPAMHGGRVFYTSSSTVSAIDIATGTLKWSFSGDGNLCTSAAIAGGGTGQVFVGSSAGIIYELDENTGAKISSHNTGGSITCSSENTSMTIASGHLLVPAGNSLFVY